jgi:hypothetical protein
VCPHVAAALARAREILGLPPVAELPEAHEALHAEKQQLAAVREELTAALERTQRLLGKSVDPGREPPDRRV